MLGFDPAHIPWNAISNLVLHLLQNALRSGLVRPSGTTVSNICRSEYALAVDALKKQLPSQKIFSLAMDGCTSIDKLAIMSVIASDMDRNWALRKVQLSFDEVGRLFISSFHS